jgi:hypothetical protein
VLRSYHAAVEQGLQDTARGLAIAVDREIEGRLSTLAALAASPWLDGGAAELTAFALHARRAAAAIGASITVIDRDLRLLFHTDLAPGEPLPPTGAADAARSALALHRPVLGSLVLGAVSRTPTILVIMPVIRDDAVVLLLATALAPNDLAQILAAQALADGGTATVLDSHNRVVARSSEQAGWVGRTAPDWLAAALAAIDAGADLVLGAHPHWVQRVGSYKGKLIIYSMGNFVFDQMWSPETRQGVIVKLTFQGNKVVSTHYIPTVIDDYNQPRPATGSDYQAVLDRMGVQP